MRYVLAELRWRQGAARRAFHTSSLIQFGQRKHNVRVVGEQRRVSPRFASRHIVTPKSSVRRSFGAKHLRVWRWRRVEVTKQPSG